LYALCVKIGQEQIEWDSLLDRDATADSLPQALPYFFPLPTYSTPIESEDAKNTVEENEAQRMTAS
jgi:hypothetical protein